MVDQIVDLMEAGMPVSSDVAAVAAGAGSAAGSEAGRKGAAEIVSGVTNGLLRERGERLDADAQLAARVDALSSNSGGGAVGSEIRDARIDLHGTTWPNLGQAVRGQAMESRDSLGALTAAGLDWSWGAAGSVMDSLPRHEGKRFIMSESNGSVEDFTNHLEDSQVGVVSDPVRVRAADGNLLARNLTAQSIRGMNAIMAVCYGKSGLFLRVLRADAMPDPLVGDDVYYMALHEWSNYPTARWELSPVDAPWLNRGHMSEPTVPAPGRMGILTRLVTDSIPTVPGWVNGGPVSAWESNIASSSMSVCTRPIRVRYSNGQAVYPLLAPTETVGDGYAYTSWGRDGRFLRTRLMAAWIQSPRLLDDEYQVSLIEFPKSRPGRRWTIGPMQHVDWLGTPSTREYTVGQGGDWETLTACLTALKDDAGAKTIRILPGEYDIYAELGGKDKWASYAGDDNWRDVQPVVPPNTRLTGVGRVVLRMTPAAGDISAKAAALLSPLNVSGSCTIENIEIVAGNCRYAVHDECSGREEFAGATHTFRHVTASRAAHTLGYGQTFGCGEARNGTYLYEDCVITGDNPYTIHTNKNSASDRTTLTFRHCLIGGAAGSAGVGLSTSWDNKAENLAVFDSCRVGGIRTYNEQSDSQLNSYRIRLMGCNADAAITHSNKNTLDPQVVNPIPVTGGTAMNDTTNTTAAIGGGLSLPSLAHAARRIDWTVAA